MGDEWIRKRGCIYWYDQYALNEQETAFARYDPDRIAAELVSTGADIVALYATNQFGIAYYPSRILPMHPGLHGRDYFGEVSSRLRAQGIKVLAYLNWLDSKHAGWNIVPPGKTQQECTTELPLVSWADPAAPNGRVQNVPGGAWQFPCPLSPRREQVVDIAREIVTRYHPGAFHLDMFHGVGICLCDRCRAVLEPLFGTSEITPEVIDAHWADYVDWRTEVSAGVVAGVSAVLREHGVVAAHNAGVPFLPVSLGFSEAWLPSLDAFVSEAYDAFLTHPSDLNSTSVIVRLMHGIGKPAWILRTSAQIHYAHWPISRAQWRLYATACKANGCHVFGPCGVGAYPDTTTAPEMLSRVKEAFDDYMADADLAEGATSAARVALAFSWNTRKYCTGGGALGSVDWVEEFTGWARLLIEEHVPYDIVVAETVSAGQLSRYDLVILPDLANLDDGVCAILREYVSTGGRILATGGTSLRDGRGVHRPDFGLGDVLGITWIASVTGHFAIERQTEPTPASGTFQQVRATGTAMSHYVRVDPAGSVAGAEDPLPLEVTGWPLWTKHALGEGLAAYVAFDIGRYFEKHGDEHIGSLMTEVVDRLLPRRQIVVNAPRTVEVTVWEQRAPQRLIVHLANRTVPWTLPTDRRQPTEIIRLPRVQLFMECPWSAPIVSCRGAGVSWQVDGHELSIVVSDLDAYAAVVMEASAG